MGENFYGMEEPVCAEQGAAGVQYLVEAESQREGEIPAAKQRVRYGIFVDAGGGGAVDVGIIKTHGSVYRAFFVC